MQMRNELIGIDPKYPRIFDEPYEIVESEPTTCANQGDSSRVSKRFPNLYGKSIYRFRRTEEIVQSFRMGELLKVDPRVKLANSTHFMFSLVGLLPVGTVSLPDSTT